MFKVNLPRFILFTFLCGFYQNGMSLRRISDENSIGNLCKSGLSSLIAHRGASADAPENTSIALREAWKQKADGCEIDIQLTADQKIVAFHDEDLNRIAGIDGSIESYSSEFLLGLDVGSWKSPLFSNARIPLLSSILRDLPPEKILFVELKEGGIPLVDKFVALLEGNKRIWSQIVVISFQFDLINRFKAKMPNLKSLYVTSWKEKPGEICQVDSLSKLIKVVNLAKTHGVDGIDLEFSPLVSPTIVAWLHTQNLEVGVWFDRKHDHQGSWSISSHANVEYLTTNTPEKARVAM